MTAHYVHFIVIDLNSSAFVMFTIIHQHTSTGVHVPHDVAPVDVEAHYGGR